MTNTATSAESVSEVVASVAGGVSPASALRLEYEEQGYAVARGVIPERRLQRVLQLYRRDILPSKMRFYRQNTNHYEYNRITPHGYVAQSFLDIHAYAGFSEFRDAALEVFFHDNLLALISELTGADSHRLVQSMLFDLNTATPPHQDWWYVDSIPNGCLVACWVALEDIHEHAGRFFVMAGSNRCVFHESGLSHSDWLKRVKTYVEQHPEKLRAPALEAGDVLFWNSRTIHGSLPTIDERYSRKSLTCHYVPGNMKFGNLFTTKDWVKYRAFRGHKYWANQPEYSLKHMLISKVKTALYDHPVLVSVLRRFQRRGIGDY
jgi:phytanoyl-CoA hydroxylase